VTTTEYTPRLTVVTLALHCAFGGQPLITYVGVEKRSGAKQAKKVKVTVVPCAEVWAVGGCPQVVICTTLSINGLELLGRSPLEVGSGVYAATIGMLPVAAGERFSKHEPIPLEAEVRVVGGQWSLNPSVILTVPVAAALPDGGTTLKFTVI
jgi:hypothetical protein